MSSFIVESGRGPFDAPVKRRDSCRGRAAAALLATSVELDLSGYYKNLLTDSRTVIPAGDSYQLDLNRLRLELKGQLAQAVALDLEYDNEVLLGSYLDTQQFGLQKMLPSPHYWDLEHTYADSGSLYGRHELYRAFLTLTAGRTDMRIGRQRIGWGTGRFWSPLDILNPFSPIQIEREERIGVDAALIEYKVGALSRLGAVYAPQHDSRDSSGALIWHDNRFGMDYSIMAGRFGQERVVGADVATQLGNAGVHGELTQVRREDGTRYARALLGLDYAFVNTLTFGGELYYNGAGTSDRAAYDFASLFAGRIQNVGRRYAGAYASYELTPLLKWTNYFVANLSDQSTFFSPSLTYSLQSNLDLTLGVQWLQGRADTEYGRLNDTYYAQLQWFF
jgi:hypothetical protein